MTNKSLTVQLGQWVEQAVVELLPDDHVWHDATFYPLPTDDGWIPSVMIYLMVQPVGNVEGMHLGEWTTPYGITFELVRGIVADFAEKSVVVRAKLRQAREGVPIQAGVAVTDVTG
jgi:hypothetical protein